jgi:DNA segregation ATPase FtsK/SpoIIIE-like protein
MVGNARLERNGAKNIQHATRRNKTKDQKPTGEKQMKTPIPHLTLLQKHQALVRHYNAKRKAMINRQRLIERTKK